MAEDQKNNDHTTQANSSYKTTPASNQNLIIGIVLGAAVLLFTLMLTKQFGESNTNSESIDITKLKQDIEDARRANAAERASRGLIAGESAETLSSKIKQDVDKLGALLASQQSGLAELNDSKATVRSLNRQVTELQDQLAQASIAAQRTSDLEQQITTLQSDLNTTNQRLASAVDQSIVDSLREQLASSRNEITRLEAEIVKLR